MRNRIALAAILLIIGFCPLTFAEVFNTASVLNSGHVSLNFEEQYNTGPEDFTFYFHTGIGLVQGVSDLCITVGVPSGSGDTYLGMDVEFVLSSRPRFSFSLGGHQQDDFGIDARFLISGRFDKLMPYIGLDSDYDFNDNGETFNVNGVLGLEIRFARNSGFIIEGAGEINSNLDVSSSYVSLGIVVYF